MAKRGRPPGSGNGSGQQKTGILTDAEISKAQNFDLAKNAKILGAEYAESKFKNPVNTGAGRLDRATMREHYEKQFENCYTAEIADSFAEFGRGLAVQHPLLGAYIATVVTAPKEKKESGGYRQQLIEFLRENKGKKLSADEIAKRLGISDGELVLS